MRSRRGVTGAALLAVALLLGGCGVARDSGVVGDKLGPQRGLGSGGEDLAVASERNDTLDRKQFVTNFLRAAAGDYQSAVDRVRKFVLPGVAEGWKPPGDPLVVRQVGDFGQSPPANGSTRVSVTLQPVGRLTDQGAIEPVGQNERALIRRDFNVEPGDDRQGGLFLRDPPKEVYLLTSALTPALVGVTSDNDVLYRPHLLYFWDPDYDRLVPDLRYLPRTLPKQQRPTEVVRRLLAGPSNFLKEARVQALPAGTDLRGNVVLEDGTLVVDVSLKATTVPIDRLMAQLRWSLWDQHEGPIRLLVEGQLKAEDAPPTGPHAENPATALATSPVMFCVADGVVLSQCKDQAAQEPPPILATPENRSVRKAAITTRADGMYGALVKTDPKGLSLRVGTAKPGEKITYVTVGSPADTMSRPVWLSTATQPGAAQGMIAADGRLYLFGADGKRTRLDGVPSNVTDVAAAPDGRRIAFIAGGQVYVAALALRPEPAVVYWRQLATSLTGLEGVAWTRPDRMVVAGAGKLAELTIDGALEEKLDTPTDNSTVTQLVAHPDNPMDGSSQGPIMVELNNALSYHVFGSLQQIQKTGTPVPSPAPTPPAEAPTVLAPFFLE